MSPTNVWLGQQNVNNKILQTVFGILQDFLLDLSSGTKLINLLGDTCPARLFWKKAPNDSIGIPFRRGVLWISEKCYFWSYISTTLATKVKLVNSGVWRTCSRYITLKWESTSNWKRNVWPAFYVSHNTTFHSGNQWSLNISQYTCTEGLCG